MARIHFDITADNSNIVSVVQDTEKRFEELSQVMADLGKAGFDLSTPAKQMKALNTAIRANEHTIRDYQKELDNLAKAQKEAALSGDMGLAEKIGGQMQQTAERMQEVVGETNQLKSALGELGGKASSTTGVMERLLGGTQNYQRIIAMLPPGMRMVISELNGMVGAARAFIATPLGAVLAALSLALASLKSFLTGAADGESEFAQISGYVSGVVKKLKDYVIQLGRELYNAFKNNLPYIKDFAVRVGGLIKVFSGLFGIVQSGFKGIFTKDWSEFNDKAKKLKDGWNQITSGQNNNPELAKLDEVGKKTAALAKQEWDLNVQREKWAIEEAKLDEKIADARVKMMSATGAERQKYAKQLQEANDQKYAQQIKFAEEELRITKERNALSENTQQDYNKEYQLEAKIYQLRAQQKSAAGMAVRIEASSGRQMARQSEEQKRKQEQLESELNAIVQSNLERRIAMMDEGGAKEVAQINANFDKQMEAIRKQKEKWIKLNKESGAGATLSTEQQAALAAAEALAASQKEKEIRDLSDKTRREYIEKYGTYNEKLLALTEEYNRKRAAANQGDENELKLLEKEYEHRLAALRKQYSATYALIFTDARNLTKSQLDLAIELTTEEIKNATPATQEYIELLNRLQAFRAAKIDSEGWGFGGLLTSLKGYEKQRAQLESAIELGSQDLAAYHAQQMAAYEAEYERSWREVASGFSELGSAMESFRDGFGGIGDTVADIGGLFSGIADQCNNMKVAFSKSATEGEKLSAGLSAALTIVSMIGSSIANNRKAQDEWNRTIEQGAHKLVMLNLAKLDYKQDNVFGVENPYKKAIDGAVQYGEAVKALRENIAKLSDGQVQVGQKKAIDWKNVGTGAAAGAALGSILPGVGNIIGASIGAGVGAIIGAFSTKTVPVFESLAQKYGTIVGENYELNPQLLADYDKLDESTKQLVDNWEEIKQKAQEAEDQMRDNFSDLAGDIGNQLSDALVNAFRNGDLYAAVDDFHSTMTKTIESILSQLVFNATFGELFKKLESDMMASFGVAGDQDITDDLLEFEKKYPELLQAYGEAMTSVQESMKKYGHDVFEDTGAEESGSRGSFSGMSQTMGASLEGRFTAVQMAAETIAERMITNMAVMTAMSNYLAGGNTTLSEIRDAHIREVGYLEDIARQTRPLSTLVSVGDKLDIIASKL